MLMEAGMPLLFSLDVRAQLALLTLSMPAKPEEEDTIEKGVHRTYCTLSQGVHYIYIFTKKRGVVVPGLYPGECVHIRA